MSVSLKESPNGAPFVSEVRESGPSGTSVHDLPPHIFLIIPISFLWIVSLNMTPLCLIVGEMNQWRVWLSMKK